jgi:hypothetical protein
MQSRIAALKQTPGREAEAARTEAVAQMIAKEPQAGKALLGMKMAAIDSKLYETLFGKSELTAFQKDLVAANVDPSSPEGRSKAAQFVQLKIDPIVEMQTPDQGKFIGPQSVYYQRYGTGAPAPQRKPLPQIGEVRKGLRFNGGNPGDPSNWSKEGAGSNTGGGFSGGSR